MQGGPPILLGKREVWPPSAPVFNLLGSFMCGVSKRDINRPSHNIKEPLINSIMEIFSNFSKDAANRACSQYQGRLKEVITAECDFIR
jgi:hypothetical protein